MDMDLTGTDVGSTDTAETPDAPHEDRLIIDRLGAAINKAQAAATSPTALSFTANGNTVNRRFINVQFTRGPFCVVPWTACHSWQVRTSAQCSTCSIYIFTYCYRLSKFFSKNGTARRARLWLTSTTETSLFSA